MSQSARPAVPSKAEKISTWDDRSSEKTNSDATQSSAVISIDLQGSVTEANSLARQVIGRVSEEIIGVHYSRFLRISHPNAETVSDYRLNDPLTASASAEQPLYSVFGALYRKDGGLEPVEFCVAPFYRGGVIAGAVLLIESDQSQVRSGLSRHESGGADGRYRQVAL